MFRFLFSLLHYLREFILRSFSILTQNFAKLSSSVTSNPYCCKPTDDKPVCPNMRQNSLRGLCPSDLWSCHLGRLFSDLYKQCNGLIFKSLTSNSLSIRQQTLEGEREIHCPQTSGNNRSVTRVILPRRIRKSTLRLRKPKISQVRFPSLIYFKTGYDQDDPRVSRQIKVQIARAILADCVKTLSLSWTILYQLVKVIS